jgi:putative ABC transport system ATP-binding protein
MSEALGGSSRGQGSLLATPAPAIALDEVVKRYAGGIVGLDHVSLSIKKNEFVALTGPSGCGKSTLLHLVAALDEPTSGTVHVNGQNLAKIRDISHFRRKEVGLVFQLHNLLPRISVLANIEVVMYGTHRNTRERRARALALLGEVDLKGRGERLPTQLSGGERQRVAIARALANEPGVLLADEPTGNLDAESALRIMELFDRVRTMGVTILLVTHDEGLARLADRTARLEAGRLVTAGDD